MEFGARRLSLVYDASDSMQVIVVRKRLSSPEGVATQLWGTGFFACCDFVGLEFHAILFLCR